MPNLQISRIKREEYFVKIRNKYTQNQVSPRWLDKLDPSGELWRDLKKPRFYALEGFISEAERLVRARKWRETVRRRLQVLGGKLRQLRGKINLEEKKKEIQEEIEGLQFSLKFSKRRTDPAMRNAIYFWHYVMVQLYHILPVYTAQRKTSSKQVRKLCDWLSIPELGVRCTPYTIKAARNRFLTVEIDGKTYKPAYVTFPKTRKLICELCQTSTRDLGKLGIHLREKHQITEEDVLLRDDGDILYEITTGNTVANLSGRDLKIW